MFVPLKVFNDRILTQATNFRDAERKEIINQYIQYKSHIENTIKELEKLSNMTYPRVGTSPSLQCKTKDNGYYNTSWGISNCTDGRPFRMEGYKDCYKTWIAKPETKCDTQCNENDDKIAGLCYPKCNPGYKADGLFCKQ